MPHSRPIVQIMNLDRKLFAGLVFCLVMVVLSSALFFYQVSQQQKITARKTIVQEAIRSQQKVMLYLVDAETAQRGFKISNDVKFLEPYYRAKTEIEGEIQNLRRLSQKQGNGSMEELETLNLAQEDIFNFYVASIGNASKKGLSLDDVTTGKEKMDALRALNDKMLEEHTSRLDAEEKKMARGYLRLMTMATFTVGFSFLTLLASVWFLNRNLQAQRHRAQTFYESKARAEEASEMKSGFLANMSHEIRTPMNGIIGVVDLLRTTPLNEEQRNFVDIIRDSANTMLALLNNILDISKIEAGKFQLEKIGFEMPSLVRSIINVFKYQAHEKGIQLDLMLADSVPHHLQGDPLRLRQVLTNLVGNAVKFTEHGQVSVRLRTLEQQSEQVIIRCEVQDTGPGIPAHVQATVFETFTQADLSTTRQHGGTGLGLSICKQLVEMMGGKIGVVSEAGRGSLFWFEVPMTKVSAEMIADDGISEYESTVQDFKEAFKVLIAEDNGVNSQVFAGMLQKMNLPYRIAENGAVAVELLRRENFDLVLMDCNMPVMDGYEAARTIRQMPPPKNLIPIIAITANVMKGDREKCLAAGMNDVISKPVSFPELQKKLYQQLLRSDLKQQVQVALDVLETLQGPHNPNFLANLIDVFLTDTPKALEDAREANRNKDTQTLVKLVHSMKSSFASFGAKAAASRAAELERLAHGLDEEEIRTKLVHLRNDFGELKEILQTLV